MNVYVYTHKKKSGGYYSASKKKKILLFATRYLIVYHNSLFSEVYTQTKFPWRKINMFFR